MSTFKLSGFQGRLHSHLSELTYNYCLKGMDSSFKQTVNKSITYTNIDPGTYDFQVQALDAYGFPSETVSIKFQILKPFWQQTWFYILIVLGSVGSIFLFIRWRTSKLKQRQKELEQDISKATNEIRQQKDHIEEKHKEITDSINYAERIQRSFLATKSLLDENLKEYFVLFQPKDVVSGDFYWATKLQNNQFALVTADSTGHGVPGAIMSILNITCLEKAVQEEKLVEPGEILNHARLNIIDRLKKDGSAEGGKDGMDASLVCFDLQNKKLSYAAANNPVWIVRPSTGSGPGEILEFAPDKMPVGKHDKQHIPFTSNQVELKTGDVVYTLTDGMPDQFGGEKGKKFMYKKLKELLISIANDPMEMQKEKLSKAFFDWKGDLEQVDDVCVIGVRI
ncbi:MAG: SpoIIE family protein phosphatase [Crocinitomicaceae bacterium]|nr:SpoIIE family protein phosphatase [Crocinitomicaceae bacterium]